MRAIALEHYGELENISRLVAEAPVAGLRAINSAINEKARILIEKNLGIALNESLLFLPDNYFQDVVKAMLINSIIDKQLAKQMISYKKLLNYRHSEYLGSDIKRICTDGMIVLNSL